MALIGRQRGHARKQTLRPSQRAVDQPPSSIHRPKAGHGRSQDTDGTLEAEWAESTTRRRTERGLHGPRPTSGRPMQGPRAVRCR